MSPAFGNSSPAKNRRRREAATVVYPPETPPTLPLNHVQAVRSSCGGAPCSLRPKMAFQKVANITRTAGGVGLPKKNARIVFRKKKI